MSSSDRAPGAEPAAPGRRATLARWGRGGRLILLTLSGASLLSACGFRRRVLAPLPFASVALEGFVPGSPLATELRRQLARQVTVLEAPAAAAVVLQAQSEPRERVAVASTSTAEVRELLLRQRLRLLVRRGDGRELVPATDWVIERTMTYRESAALAKGVEEAEVFREMQADLVAQVLRRLAALSV